MPDLFVGDQRRIDETMEMDLAVWVNVKDDINGETSMVSGEKAAHSELDTTGRWET